MLFRSKKIMRGIGGYTRTLTFASLCLFFGKLAQQTFSGDVSAGAIYLPVQRGKTTRKLVPGYTLVEMIVVIAIATMTILAVSAAVILFYRSNTKSLNQAYTVESARQGILQTVKDIRSIQYGADGSFPIAAIATSSFMFYTDVNGDGVTEQVRYSMSGTDFVRSVISATGSPPTYPSSGQSTTTQAHTVRNWLTNTTIFRFYSASSTEITSLATTTISYVTITLVVNQNVSTSTGDYTLRSTAALRNASQF